MVRRASSRISLTTVLLAAFLVLAAIGAGVWFLFNTSNPFRTVQPLDTEAYLQNANSLRGNVYRIEGVIQNSLAYSATQGRLVSVQIGDGDKSDRIAVLVPPSFGQVNLQKGQRYQFKVEIVKDGVVEARDLRKS